jgi:DNA-directed RNA polymerase subunit RPC12/RpoP
MLVIHTCRKCHKGFSSTMPLDYIEHPILCGYCKSEDLIKNGRK